MKLIYTLAALLMIAACAAGGGAGWTFAPLGPTPSVAPSDGQPSGGPSGSPGNGLVFDVVTTDADPLAFDPNVIEAQAATQITVNYLNDNTLQHNINFFAGPDSSAPSLGMTPVVTGPGALESVTFTTPDEPGDYLFWCDVHAQTMIGTLRIAE